jgi:tagatose 1,6-diphosphate aldolase
MSSFTFLDPGLLQDADLTLIIAKTTPADPARGYVPAYEFTMRVNNHEAGRLNFRAQNTPLLEFVGGHLGYDVHPPFRGHHYAARACQLVLPLARAHGFKELIITCNPSNWASRKTAEWLGAKMVEIVNVPSDHDMYKKGELTKCRYQLIL